MLYGRIMIDVYHSSAVAISLKCSPAKLFFLVLATSNNGIICIRSVSSFGFKCDAFVYSDVCGVFLVVECSVSPLPARCVSK